MSGNQQSGSERKKQLPAGQSGRRSLPITAPSWQTTLWLDAIAIFSGVVLLALAVIVTAWAIPLPYTGMLMVAGVAAIFAGIGSQAAVKLDLGSAGQAGSAGGAAAIAILLAYAFPPDGLKFVRGEIHGIDSRKERLTIVSGSRTILSGIIYPSGYRFSASGDDLASGLFYIDVEHQDKTETYIWCLPTSMLKRELGSSKEMNLELDPNKGRLTDLEIKVSHGSLSDSCSNSADSSRSAGVFNIGNLGHSLAMLVARPARAQNAAAIADAISDLRSDDLETRNAARQQMIKTILGSNSLGGLLDNWNVTDSSYREDLGIMLVLAGVLRQRPSLSGYALDAFSSAQLTYLMALTGHPNTTLRLSATEVMLQLLRGTKMRNDDPAAVRLADLTAQPFRTNGKTPVELSGKFPISSQVMMASVLTAIKESKCDLSARLFAQIDGTLRQFTAGSPPGSFPQTKAIIQEIEGTTCSR